MSFDYSLNKVNVVFMGTPQIATAALKALINKNYNVIAIVTQPDKELGRKKNIIFSPVKELAKKLNIKLFQPEKIADIKNELINLKPDLFVTCAYGQFIPNSILEIPKYGCINTHASLLPRHRGGAPIHWSIIKGDTLTGVTLMKTIKQMDAGDIFISYSVSISEMDNLKTLFNKIEKVIYLIIYNELHKIIFGKLPPIKQNESLVTFAYNISRTDEKINLNDYSHNINNWVRGLYESPCGYLMFGNLKVKIFSIKITKTLSNVLPGMIVNIDKNGIEVATKDKNILIEEFQIEGKKRINIKNYISGNKLFKIGSFFH